MTDKRNPRLEEDLELVEMPYASWADYFKRTEYAHKTTRLPYEMFVPPEYMEVQFGPMPESPWA